MHASNTLKFASYCYRKKKLYFSQSSYTLRNIHDYRNGKKGLIHNFLCLVFIKTYILLSYIVRNFKKNYKIRMKWVKQLNNNCRLKLSHLYVSDPSVNNNIFNFYETFFNSYYIYSYVAILLNSINFCQTVVIIPITSVIKIHSTKVLV